MTDNFKFIYKILRALEAAMDYPEFDISQNILKNNTVFQNPSGNTVEETDMLFVMTERQGTLNCIGLKVIRQAELK